MKFFCIIRRALSVCFLLPILSCSWLNSECLNYDATCGIWQTYFIYQVPAGHGMTVWPLNNDVYARYYSTQGGWRSAEIIDTQSTATSSVDVAVNRNGQAIAVWIQNDGAADSVYAAYFENGKWNTAEVIDNQPIAAATPRAGMDASGNAFVIMNHSSSHYETRRINGSWTTPVILLTLNSVTTPYALSVSEDGNATIAFTASGTAAQGFTYSAGTQSWSAVQSVGTTTAFYGISTTGNGGNAGLVWTNNTLGPDAMVSLYSNGSWSTEQSLQANSDEATIARSRDGNYTAAFVDSGSYDRIYGRRYNGSSWESSQTISSFIASYPGSNAIQMAANDYVVVVWPQLFSGANHLFGNSYITGWQTAVQIDTQSSAVTKPQVGVDSLGNNFVCYLQSDGSFESVWAATGTAGNWQTPIVVDQDQTTNITQLGCDYK